MNTLPTESLDCFASDSNKCTVICAINGIAFGGGFEMLINADLVIASAFASLGLPEVKRGVVAL